MIRITAWTLRTMCAILLASAMFASGGCGGYKLHGKVIQGEVSSMEIVHVLDARLKQPGIDNAQIMIYRDPNSPNRKLSTRTRTDVGGNFSIGLDEFGAGWMEEQWMIRAWLSKFQNAEGTVKLPSKTGKVRLLITLAPGVATPPVEPDAYMDQFEEFK